MGASKLRGRVTHLPKEGRVLIVANSLGLGAAACAASRGCAAGVATMPTHPTTVAILVLMRTSLAQIRDVVANGEGRRDRC